MNENALKKTYLDLTRGGWRELTSSSSWVCQTALQPNCLLDLSLSLLKVSCLLWAWLLLELLLLLLELLLELLLLGLKLLLLLLELLLLRLELLLGNWLTSSGIKVVWPPGWLPLELLLGLLLELLLGLELLPRLELGCLLLELLLLLGLLE